MKYIIHIFILIVLHISTAICQAQTSNIGLGMNGITATINTPFGNPAGLIYTRERYVELNLGMPYQIMDMPSCNVLGTLKANNHRFGIGGSYTNCQDVFLQTSLSYSIQISQNINIGVGMDYEQVADINSIGNRLGIVYNPNNYLSFGTYIGYGQNKDYLVSLGLKIEPLPQSTIHIEITHNSYERLKVNLGGYFNLTSKLSLLCGIGTSYQLWAVGFNYRIKSFQIGISNQFHKYLGHTPNFALIIQK